MFWFGKKEEVIVSLDIGTEFVKAILISRDGRNGHVLGAGLKRQSLGEMKSGVVMDLGEVVDNSEEAIERAFKNTRNHDISGVILGMAGESVKGTVTEVEYERTYSEEEIKIEELRNIVQKLQWDSFSKARREIAQEIGSPEIDVKLVSSGIVSAKIDGVRVSNPLGFVGKKVVLSVFTSFAPLLFHQALRSVVNSLRLPLLDIVATPYAISSSLSFESGDDGDVIFIDVGGGTTDIAITKYGGIIGQKSFTMGGRTFTKNIMDNLNLSFNEAEKVKIEYSNGKLVSESEKLTKKILKSSSEIWIEGVKMALEEFETELLPKKIVLCGGGSLLPEVKERLSDEAWISEMNFSSEPKIRFAQTNEITNIVDDFEKIDSSQYVVCLALGSLAVRESDENNSFLEKIWQGAFKKFNFRA